MLFISMLFGIFALSAVGMAKAGIFAEPFRLIHRLLIEAGMPVFIALAAVYGVLAAIGGIRLEGSIGQRLSRFVVAALIGLLPAALFVVAIGMKYGF